MSFFGTKLWLAASVVFLRVSITSTAPIMVPNSFRMFDRNWQVRMLRSPAKPLCWRWFPNGKVFHMKGTLFGGCITRNMNKNYWGICEFRLYETFRTFLTVFFSFIIVCLSCFFSEFLSSALASICAAQRRIFVNLVTSACYSGRFFFLSCSQQLFR